MSKLKQTAITSYEFIVGTISGAVNWGVYTTLLCTGPSISYMGMKTFHKQFFGHSKPLKQTILTGMGAYGYLADTRKIESFAKNAAKHAEKVVEKGFMIDYVLSPNSDAYGAFDALNDIGKETVSLVRSKYQVAVATASKLVYAGTYVGAWVAHAIPAAIIFNLLSNIANKVLSPHKHTSLLEIDALKSKGAVVATVAIGAMTNPEIHNSAKLFAKNCELIAEEILGVTGDQVGLLDSLG